MSSHGRLNGCSAASEGRTAHDCPGVDREGDKGCIARVMGLAATAEEK